MQKITLIVAKSKNNCIGKDGKLPWHLPEDLAFFKAYTLGKVIIMGRCTWESLPKKPLYQRKNVVISSQADYKVQEGVQVFTNIKQAVQNYKSCKEICIIGGEKIYQQTISLATDLRVTQIDQFIAGDKFFPNINLKEFTCINRQSFINQKGLLYSFEYFIRNTK